MDLMLTRVHVQNKLIIGTLHLIKIMFGLQTNQVLFIFMLVTVIAVTKLYI